MTQNTKRKFRYLIGLLILVGLVSGSLYFLFSKSEPAEASWFDESWLYRQKVEITNSGSNQTDFQVLITLDTATLITAGKMQSNCNDIRATDINGKLLSHWFEPSTCNTSTSKIWAKVPSIPTTGATVYVYYGNPSASSVSSPANTFIREISGVQGAWSMDESSWTNDCSTNTALDSSGNSNHAKSCPVSTGPNTTSTAQFGRAGSFDGTNDYVNAGNGASLSISDKVTVEAWVKFNSLPSQSGVLSKGIGGWANTDYGFLVTDSKLYGYAYGLTSLVDAGITTGTWHHIALVIDASSFSKMYRDGAQIASANINGSIQTSSRNFYIGANWNLNYFNGSIDEVRIYNKALSAAEISDLYGTGGDRQGYSTTNYPNKVLVRKYSASVSTGSPSSEERGPGPVGYWKFDEGYGQTANDTTLNNNDGTLGSTSGSDTNDPTWQTEDMCVSGKCLKFDGTDDYLSSNFQFSIFNFQSISQFINFQTLATGKPIIGKWGNSQNAILLKTDDTNSDELKICVASGLTDNCTNYGITTDANIAASAWYNVQIIYDGTQSANADKLKLYLNGAQKTLSFTGTIPSVLQNSSGALEIGGDSNLATYSNARIDDVKIYPYARTAAQIKADYASRGTAKGASAVIGGGPSTSSGQYPLSQGLIGYWKMDESSWTNDCSTATVTDSSGAGNHGKSCPASTGPNTTSTAKFAKAGSFDGVDDYVSLNTISDITFNKSYSVSLWAKINDISSIQNIFTHTLSSGDRSAIYIFDGVIRAGTRNNSTDSGASGTISLGWAHIVFVHQSAGANYLYLNSVNQTGTSVPGMYSMAVFTIGSAAASSFFNGSIDEVRIYNRALSPKEVRDLYNWAPGPVAHWKMDEKTGQYANDSSGSGNTGTLGASSGTESSDPTWAVGKFGAGLQFDGSDDYVDVGNGASLQITNSITLESWFRVSGNSSNGYHTIFSKNGDLAHDYRLLVNDARTTILFQANDGAISQSGIITAFDLNTWHHFAATYNGAFVVTYFDGRQIDSDSQTGTINNNYTIINIGKTFGNNYFLNGLIDDVRIYNYARTQKQIIEDMNAGHPAGGSPVGSQVGYWKFDEGYGGTAQDSSPQNNDGTLYPGSGGSNTTTAQMWSNSAKFGKAMEFDGTDDYVDVGSNSSLTVTGEVTIALWIKTPQPTKSWQGFFDARDNTLFVGGYSSTGKPMFRLNNTSWSQVDVISDDILNANEWYHIAATYNKNLSSNQMKLYMNGILKKEGNQTGDIANLVGYTRYIGRRSEVDGYYFSGLIDEVKIYNYALTEDEIKLEYNRGAAVMLGAVSTDSSSNPSYSSERSYCIPGDTSTCSPPVAEWNLNEKTGQSANDSSGSGNTGTLGSSSAEASDDPSWTSGKIGAGLKFDGSNDYVSVPSWTPGNDITFESWVKIDQLLSSGVIKTIWAKGSTSANAVSVYFYSSDGATMQLFYGVEQDGSNKRYWYTAIPLTANIWHHVAVTQSGGPTATPTFYFGGQSYSATLTTSAGTPVHTAADGAIGRFGTSASYYFNGLIDDVRIYNYARTPAQIAWDYNRGKPVAHWKFDECQGGTAYDASGNANNGTITIGASGTQTGIGTCTNGNTANARYNGRNGKYNSALNFDGTDDYVDAGNVNSALKFTGDFTLEAWIKTSSSDAHQRYIIGYADYTTDTNGYEFFVSNGKVGFYIDDASGPDILLGNKIISDNNWHHVVATTNSTTKFIYVDGVFDNSNARTKNPTYTTHNFKIGLADSSGYYFTGSIDEVKIYNYALTPLQIKQAYNEGAAIRFGPVTGSP